MDVRACGVHRGTGRNTAGPVSAAERSTGARPRASPGFGSGDGGSPRDCGRARGSRQRRRRHRLGSPVAARAPGPDGCPARLGVPGAGRPDAPRRTPGGGAAPAAPRRPAGGRADQTLRPAVGRAIARLPGMTAAEPLDAATIKVNGELRPDARRQTRAQFRAFAAGPTARSTALWRNVASGSIARLLHHGQAGQARAGRQRAPWPASDREADASARFGTVGIAGVDAVVSDSVARSLGIPAGNALVISAPTRPLARADRPGSRRLLPHGAGVAQLVVQAAPGVTGSAAGWPRPGAAGATSVTAADGRQHDLGAGAAPS